MKGVSKVREQVCVREQNRAEVKWKKLSCFVLFFHEYNSFMIQKHLRCDPSHLPYLGFWGSMQPERALLHCYFPLHLLFPYHKPLSVSLSHKLTRIKAKFMLKGIFILHISLKYLCCVLSEKTYPWCSDRFSVFSSQYYNVLLLKVHDHFITILPSYSWNCIFFFLLQM